MIDNNEKYDFVVNNLQVFKIGHDTAFKFYGALDTLNRY